VNGCVLACAILAAVAVADVAGAAEPVAGARESRGSAAQPVTGSVVETALEADAGATRPATGEPSTDATGTVARASRGPGLVGARVLVVPDARPAHADDDERVVTALRASGLNPVAVEVRAGIDGDVVGVPRGDRERVRAQLAESRARARQLDLPVAQAAVAAARDEGLRLERPEDQRELLVDLLVHDATLRLSVDKQDRPALAALRVAARLEPERAELDPALHAPSIVAAWARARAENAAAGTVLVVVEPRIVGVHPSTPVELVVDGVVRPVENRLVSLATGPHLVTMRAPGCRPVSQIVDVVAESGPLATTLQPADAPAKRAAAVAALRVPARAPGFPGAWARLAALTGAEVIVLLGEQPLAWRAATGPRDVRADPGDVAAFALAVEQALADGATPPPFSGDVATPLPPPMSSSSMSGAAPDGSGFVAAAVVAGVVVVVAGAVAATIALWPASPPGPPPRPVVVTAYVP
jgi:hypothetical protein